MMRPKESEQLERQGCWSEDWSQVTISEDTDLSKIRNVLFRGKVTIGANTEIINVPGGLSNVRIGDNVRIVNVARIESRSGATFGIGTDVKVLDETGSRPVCIYPGISAQIATLASRFPEFSRGKLTGMIDTKINSLPDMLEIGDNVEIFDCGSITEVRIWPGARLEGAMYLKNGSIVNNSSNGKPLAYVGHGVDAENFIIEDGRVSGGCFLRNCHVGQGCELDKRFTAHDSLFFANCQMENGEACAVLAGPYSVSMHKSSLLIGAHVSFMNAGSGTNMSNHLYKLGPIHWGVMERGVKTASNAYVMHGSRIGAFSLVMGEHKTHPDTSPFPFSYLFGDAKGNTNVVPGAMLKSYGLKRDSEKWPMRDRRLGHGLPLHDRINFSVLNPVTAARMMRALMLEKNLTVMVLGEEIDYNGLKLTKKHLREGSRWYEFALSLYVCRHLAALEMAGRLPIPQEKNRGVNADADKLLPKEGSDWLDLTGQLIPATTIEDIKKAESIEEIEKILDRVAEDYDKLETDWIAENLELWIRNADVVVNSASNFLDIIEKDRKASKDLQTDYPL